VELIEVVADVRAGSVHGEHTLDLGEGCARDPDVFLSDRAVAHFATVTIRLPSSNSPTTQVHSPSPNAIG
jgi:hypothetical protein